MRACAGDGGVAISPHAQMPVEYGLPRQSFHSACG
jgi:hypothetical protein